MEPPISKRRSKWRLESLPDLNLGLDELYPGGERTPTLNQVLGRESYTLTPPIELQAGPAIIERRGEPRLQLEADPAIIEQRGEAPRALTDLLPPWKTGLARETRLPEDIEQDMAPLRALDIEKILLGEEGQKTPEEQDTESMEQAQQARSGTTRDAVQKVRADVSESLRRDLDPLRNLDLTSILDAQQTTDPQSERMPPPIGLDPVEIEAGRKYLDPVEVEAGRKYLDPVEVRAGEDYSGEDPTTQLDPVEVQAGRDYMRQDGETVLDPVEVRAGEDYGSQPKDDGVVRLDPVEVQAGVDYSGNGPGMRASGGMTSEVSRTTGGAPAGPAAPAPAQRPMPPAPAPAQRPMPPPIEDPRRRNVDRNRALAIASAVSGSITGRGDRYQQSLDRQNAEADRDYAVQVDRYNRQVAERDKMRGQAMEDYDRFRKYASRDRVVPDSILGALSEHWGVEVPPGTTVAEVDDYVRSGMNAIGANRIQGERDKAAAAASLAEKDRARMLDQQNRIALVQERAKYSKKGKGGGGLGGGGGGGLGGAGRRAFQLSQAVGDAVMAEQGFGEGDYMEALQDIRYGFARTKRAQAIASAVGNDEIKEAVKLAESQGKSYAARTAQNARKITGYFDISADERAGLAAWDEYKRTHSKEHMQRVFEGVASGSEKTLNKEEQDFVTAVRRPIASFLRQMTGAAMTPAELGLHAGMAGGMLVNPDGTWASVEGMSKILDGYLNKRNARPGQLMSLIARVRELAQKRMEAVARGAPIAALRAMPADQQVGYLRTRVDEALNAGLERPFPGARVDPASIKLDNYRIRFNWEDGSPGEVLDE